jgi:hypothetical protein
MAKMVKNKKTKQNKTKPNEENEKEDFEGHKTAHKIQPNVGEKSPSPTAAAVSYHQHHQLEGKKMSARVRGRLENSNGLQVDDIYNQRIVIVIRGYVGGQDDKKRNDRRIIIALKKKIKQNRIDRRNTTTGSRKTSKNSHAKKKGVERFGDDAIDICGWERENTKETVRRSWSL